MDYIEVKLDPGAFEPVRAHDDDAGMDLKAKSAQTIFAGGSMCFDTGVHLSIPKGYYGKIESKSGLNVRHGVVCCGGVIDASYRGSIVVKLYNLSERPYYVEAGEKIAQLLIVPCETPKLKLVDSLDDTERGNGGFGSTGRF